MKMQPYNGSYIKGNLGGVKVSNPSLVKYYGDKIMPRTGFAKGTMPARNKKKNA